jgi:hypothetical protein
MSISKSINRAFHLHRINKKIVKQCGFLFFLFHFPLYIYIYMNFPFIFYLKLNHEKMHFLYV